jgi:AraC-like DNA-binding protein
MMPSSAAWRFTDPDEYAGSIRAGTVETTVTERGNFAAELIRIDFHRLWMQRFSENLPRVLHSANQPGRAAITFRAQPGPTMLHSGIEMPVGYITRHSIGDEYYQRSSGPVCFGTMSLPMEDIDSIGTMAGRDLMPPRNTLMAVAPRDEMGQLQRLHAAAGHLADTTPEIIANPDAARGLEQLLLEALVDCLGDGRVGEDRVAQRHHELIMRRFHRLLTQNPGRPLYIPEICKAIGVSERTLRVCCQEQLGIGPKHYLLLRRLHLVRRALREAAPQARTVTDIATRYGFWQFGLFARHYRSLFGEVPSATLNRPSS